LAKIAENCDHKINPRYVSVWKNRIKGSPTYFL
jgi:hypothetical protein